MLNKKGPALKSCSQKRCKSSGGEMIDWLSKLPDEIFMHIMSSLTLKEAARTSIVSHRWKDLWRYHRTLNFENPTACKRMYKVNTKEVKGQERTNFISWVNDVMNSHIGLVVDELRIVFDLDESCQCPIDKWMEFAFEKHVKRLDLNFLMGFRNYGFCPLPLECLPHNLASNSRSLTSLLLQQVNITTEAVEHILNSLPLLEQLGISTSYALTSLRISGMSSKLTYLKVFDCQHLEVLDISTPKLLSFEYYGHPINLHVENASSLSKVFVGGRLSLPVEPSFHSLYQYFPQLELLHFRFFLHKKLNLGINQVPALPNLKHLKLEVFGKGNMSILGWIPLVEASPLLQNLTVKFIIDDFITPRPIPKRYGKPLRSLKTLEILGFVGWMIDLEFATYVLENACGLEQVSVSCDLDRNGARGRAKKLVRKLPQGARFILLESAKGGAVGQGRFWTRKHKAHYVM